MRRNLQKWGNSLAVRIPSTVAQECHLTEGAPVEVRTENGRIVLIPARPLRPKHELGRLVRRIKRTNRHTAVDDGLSRGHEIW